MTDLENLWDDYPVDRAPVTAILAAAAGEKRRRRRLFLRPVLTAGAVTGLAGAFVAGTLVNGGGPGTPGADELPRHAAFQADLEPAKSCDELLTTYVERGKELVGPYGWGGGPIEYAHLESGDVIRDSSELSGAARNSLRDQAFDSATKSLPRTDRQVNSETGTNVQEAAVDEPDTVKTDGKLLITVRDDDLVTYDVTGSSTEQLSSIALPGIEDAEILLSGDTVVAIGADDEAAARPSDLHGDGYADPGGTRVLTVSLADPAEPEVAEDVTYDAGLLSARQHGSTVRLVLTSGLPDLAFVEPKGGEISRSEAERQNRTLVEESTIEDWLPSTTAGGKSRQLLDCTDVAIPSDDLAIDTTSIVGFDAAEPGKLDAIGLAGHTGIAYESADHLFLATEAGGGFVGDCRVCSSRTTTGAGGTGGTAHLFDFALDGPQATHVASGEVEGSVRDRWSVDEADGVIRLAVGPSTETGNFNSIVTLERRGKQLVEKGRLDQLGPNEEIKSVRWFDDLAILVTFRQVDPLYAIDLTDTAAPELLGKLKIPGFSSYLHPLGSWRMIGVGEGPDGKGGWGAQIGLFDVRDVTKVKRLDVHSYGRDFAALAGADPRAFTWLPDERTIITVLERWTNRRSGYVSVIKVVDGALQERLVQVEYGDDVDLVRAVPMPDGRVVLVTGDKAQFFEL
ncbi:hypothetical protein ASE01_00835 [Nocardioides sp. Root190]|uniref:beta-propeller domain-containing protein n=1 Tax=Nocardioides sp. Root190 TaxID=1736488 RepID=UPI00070101AE|nr:beta-propeller domain-containing protein [Nocardioides sp. Root190]KRB80085.1 hypothetical protein ASE01_00835 [Nocardioides sp. Root190]